MAVPAGRLLVTMAGLTMAAGCGSATTGAAPTTKAHTATSAVAQRTRAADGPTPCMLLNSQQVATVLPDAPVPTSTMGADTVIDGTTGESTCRWGTPSRSLTLVVDDITASRLATRRLLLLDDPQTAGLGDIGGVLSSDGATEMIFLRHTTEVDLTLRASGQDTRPMEAAMVALGRAIAPRF